MVLAPMPEPVAGLSEAEARARLKRDGPNLLPQGERRSPLRIVLSVLAEPMLLLLLGAATIYLLLGDAQEAALLGVSVQLVIGMTVYQEQRAETALQALRDLSSPRARVWRDGDIRIVPARELVVGDRIELAEGDRVPADARLLEVVDFEVDESLLTGESLPVVLDPRSDSATAHASTLVVRGHGSAEVIATGIATEVGRIGQALHGIQRERSPMQVQIRGVVLLFTALAFTSSLLVTLLYALGGAAWMDAILAGITLAIATIPEEFPVVLTVFLAFGGWRMARRRALVRRAPAIEALGAVQVLCTDKTGTLTENRMAVAGLWPGLGDDVADEASRDSLLLTALAASPPQSFDAMEQALRTAAGADSAAAREHGNGHLREYPIAPDRPAMAHVWREGDQLRVACKGAPETVAALCRLDDARLSRLHETLDALAGQGLRLLGVAEAQLAPDAPLPETLVDLPLQWRGLVGFADPLREGVVEAVADVQAAGVQVLMLTGDHLRTASAIAGQLGIHNNGSGAMLGAELDQLDDAALDRALAKTAVFARVRPEHKLRLVEALKRRGQRVAMTGDGVNDAPALMAAHVGVAMGGRGTDVAREAASIVLLDDNFITIVDAIRMGRGIYDNIRRALHYILAVHVPITGLALLPALLGGGWVLMPLHVVFLELIIDPTCSIVFEREPLEDDIMRRRPRPADEAMLGWLPMLASLSKGALMFAAVAAVYFLAGEQGYEPAVVSALAFTALVAGNIGLMAVFRSGRGLRRALSPRNRSFWIIAGVATLALVLATQLPAAAQVFGFVPPPLWPWLAALGLPLLLALLIRFVDGFPLASRKPA